MSKKETYEEVGINKISEDRAILSKDIDEIIEKIHKIIYSYPPFDMIANILLRNAVLDGNNYKEHEHDGNDAFVEYIALQYLLKKPEELYFGNVPIINPQHIEAVQELTRHVFTLASFEVGVKDLERANPRDNDELGLHLLRFNTIAKSISVRYPTYKHILIDQLRGIFAPIDEQLIEKLGFSMDDAINIFKAIEQLPMSRILDKKQQAKNCEPDLKRAVNKYRKKKKGTKGFKLDVLKRFAELKPTESNIAIRNSMINFIYGFLGDTFSFSVDDLQGCTKLDQSRVKLVLDSFSIEFGAIEEFYMRPSPTHPLMEFSLIKHNDKYFCPSPNGSFYMLRSSFEAFLSPSHERSLNKKQKTWKKYEENRASYTECQAMEFLSMIFPGSKSYSSLKYVSTEGGQSKECELDGLLIFDNALFLVEVKAGALSDSARRGSPSRMKKDLRKLVENAYHQALRAKNFIKSNKEAHFKPHKAKSIKINSEHFDYVFLINVNLEHLDPFITNISKLQGIGLFSHGEYPWSCSLSDLRIISETVEFSAQFVHYLQRRERVNELGVIDANDELDWWGNYLQQGLFFDELFAGEDKPQFVNLLTFTTVFDDYYFYQTGQRSLEAPKPTQPIPGAMYEIISELESLYRDGKIQKGYLDIACLLLDLSGEERDRFAEQAILRRERAVEKELISDFTQVLNDKARTGLTFLFSPTDDLVAATERLEKYCFTKKYQFRSEKWVGLVCIAKKEGWIHQFIIMDQPWAFDQQMEHVVEYFKNLAREAKGVE